MGIEKDFLKRETEKLSLLLSSLIEKISGLNSNNAKNNIEKVNEALINEFDLDIKELPNLKNSELLKRMENIQLSHLEKLAELLYAMVSKSEFIDFNESSSKIKITKKAILLIDLLNEKSSTFSIKRMHMKNALLKQTP